MKRRREHRSNSCRGLSAAKATRSRATGPKAPIRPGACATLCVLTTLPALVGCVERRLIITSDPPGAAVTLNDVDVGLTPVEVDFTWYGTYDVQLRKPGYEALSTSAEAEAPWYEWPGIDIISQAIPPRDETEIRWHFELEPTRLDEAELLERARRARELMPEPETETVPPAGE